LVKGTTRRVIVIKSPDRHLFDEAIFIVREDRSAGVTGDDILREAQEVADQYVKRHVKRNLLSKLPAPFFALVGAAVTALVWFASQYLF